MLISKAPAYSKVETLTNQPRKGDSMENEVLNHVRELVLASPEYQHKCQEVKDLQSELCKAGWKIEELEKAIQLTDNEKQELAATVKLLLSQLDGAEVIKVSSIPEYLEKIGIDREQMVRDLSRIRSETLFDEEMWTKLAAEEIEEKGELKVDMFGPVDPKRNLGEPARDAIDNDCEEPLDTVTKNVPFDLPDDPEKLWTPASGGNDNNCDGDVEEVALIKSESPEPPRGFWGFIFRWMFKISFWRR